MGSNNYSKAEDFILDDSFFRYTLYGEDPGNVWKIFIKENTALSKEIDTAKKMIVYLKTSQKPFVGVNKKEELAKLIKRINRSEKRIKLSHRLLKYAAAILLLITFGRIIEVDDLILFKNYYAKEGNTEIILSDGTNIDLRVGSSIKVSRFYNSRIRNIKLKGEAFFNVTRNENKRFIVDLKKSKVIVLGTAFNVNSNNDSSVVMVSKGKVLFKSNKKDESIILTKNMCASHTSSYKIQRREFNINKIGWSTGIFHFNNQKLPHILNLLESYYSVHFNLNPRLKEKTISFHADNMELEEVLTLLEEIVPDIHYELSGEIITIN